jgi:hypothetical protein
MNRKQRIDTWFRGWIPKEPVLSTRQASADSRFPVFVRWLAIAVVVGSIAGALLGVAGVILGLTEGIGVYAWPISTALIIGVGIGLFAVYMRRKLGLQARNYVE